MSRLPVLPISESNIGVKGFHPLCMVLLEQIPPGIFNWEGVGGGTMEGAAVHSLQGCVVNSC